MTQERFAWLEPATQFDHELTLAVGPGYCTIKSEAGAYATVSELRNGLKPGHLISATALVHLRNGVDRRWVLLRRDAGAPVDANKWQFPAGRTSPDELPLTTACRELSEEVSLCVSGARRSWADARIRVGGGPVSYLRQDRIDHFKGRYVYAHNTLEFYYPMELAVESFDDVTLSDNEHYGRAVQCFPYDEVERLAQAGALTDAARALWDAAKAEGVLVLP